MVRDYGVEEGRRGYEGEEGVGEKLQRMYQGKDKLKQFDTEELHWRSERQIELGEEVRRRQVNEFES